MEPVLEQGQHGPGQPELCVRPSGTGKASSCDIPQNHNIHQNATQGDMARGSYDRYEHPAVAYKGLAKPGR